MLLLWALPTDHSWQMHLCNIEEQQTNQHKMPQQNAPMVQSASEFLSTLNKIHP